MIFPGLINYNQLQLPLLILKVKPLMSGPAVGNFHYPVDEELNTAGLCHSMTLEISK